MAKKICLGCMEYYEDKYSVCPYCGYAEGSAPKEPYHIKPGTVLQGKYIVGQSIGYGGFGVTYIGYDFAMNRKLAIKEYLPSEFSTRSIGETDVTVFEGEKGEQFDSGIEKFVDEAKRLKAFQYVDGVVSVYDSFRENNTAYIVMEYLEGETLKELLEKKKKIEFDEAVGYMIPILDALTALHKDELLHRDISPDNIFITNDGKVKLIDFGASRYATTTHSRSLSVIIKPGYAPQEQYRSRGDQGPWTDVYACAATLYKMITGITPEDSMERGEKDNLKRPRKAGAKIPKNKETAIMNALNLKVEDRTRSAEDFKKELITNGPVKRLKNTMRKMDIGQWPLGVKIAAAAGTVLVATFFILMLTGVIKFSFDRGFHWDVGDKTTVPEVKEKELSDAEALVKDADLKVLIVGKENSDEIAKNLVLSQKPHGGKTVNKGTDVKITISAGAATVFMENYIGLSKEEGISSLEECGLGYLTEEGESVVKPGCVFAQSIEEGEEVEKSSQVTLKISTGIPNYDKSKDTTVPNIVNDSWETACNKVRDKHLYIFVTKYVFDKAVPKGCVIEQDKKPDSKVKEGDEIGVKVSLGIEMIRVPDMEYKSGEDAIRELEGLGFEVEKVEQDSEDVADGLVISMSMNPGEEVPATTDGKKPTIIVYISKGRSEIASTSTTEATTEGKANGETPGGTSQNPGGNKGDNGKKDSSAPAKKQVSVPSLSGMSKTEAESALKKAGLSGSFSYVSGDKKDDGKVVGQSPSSGKVDVGSVVSVSICKYNAVTVAVPNVKGKKEADAKSEITGQKLSVKVVYQNGKKSDDGKVMNQSPASGEKVAEGSEVLITVCKYKAIVPNLVGMTKDSAISVLKNADLKYKVNTVDGAKADNGKVTSQSVSAGSEVESQKEITIDVCEYRPVVPDVVGKSKSDAVALLQEEGFNYTIINEKTTSKKQDGIVKSQSVAANSKGTLGQTVTITVYGYKLDSYPVPDVKGQTITNAGNILSSSEGHFVIYNSGTTLDTTEKSKAGRVAKQDPSAGKSLTENSTVTVSLYVYKVQMPSLINLDETSAKSAITSAGLKVGNVSYKSFETSKNNRVLSQSIDSGTLIDEGTTVDLVICDNSKVTWYRYKDVVSYESTTTTVNEAPSGYVYVKEEQGSPSYSDWGGWSGWTTSVIGSSDVVDVDTTSGKLVGTYFNVTNVGVQDHPGPDGSGDLVEEYVPDSSLWNYRGPARSGGPERYYVTYSGWSTAQNCYHGGDSRWQWEGTLYRSRTRTKSVTTTYYWQKPVWGDWSGWSQTPVYGSSEREVDTREWYWDETP